MPARKFRVGPNGTLIEDSDDPIVRDGEVVTFSMAFMDSRGLPAASQGTIDMQTTFTDAQRSFADSFEGQRYVSLAQRKHRAAEGHKGPNARPWSDADTHEAIRRGAAAHARVATDTAAMVADAARRLPVLEAERQTALTMRRHAITDAYWNRG